MNFNKIKEWWDDKGKILVYKILVIILFIGPIVQQIPALQNYVPYEIFYLIIIAET